MKFVNNIVLATVAVGLASPVCALELDAKNGVKLSMGGYVKAQGIYFDPDGSDRFFEGDARETRFNISTARTVEGHQAQVFIEGDFWDNHTTMESDNSHAWRLRHAYLKVDNFTAGQTWNGQFMATARLDTEIMDFWNLGYGTIWGNGAVIRSDIVLHYKLGGALLTLQDPVYADADVPDLVASYSLKTGNGHEFNVAVTGREVDTGISGSEYGAAVSVASRLQFGKTSVHLSAFTGEGAGVYAGWGYNGMRGAATSDVNEAGDLITVTGFAAGMGHRFSDKIRANLRYAQVKADEVASNIDDDTLKLMHANLIYTYVPGIEFGIEWRDQSAATRPPTSASSSLRPAGRQFEVMAKYRF